MSIGRNEGFTRISLSVQRGTVYSMGPNDGSTGLAGGLGRELEESIILSTPSVPPLSFMNTVCGRSGAMLEGSRFGAVFSIRSGSLGRVPFFVSYFSAALRAF